MPLRKTKNKVYIATLNNGIHYHDVKIVDSWKMPNFTPSRMSWAISWCPIKLIFGALVVTSYSFPFEFSQKLYVIQAWWFFGHFLRTVSVDSSSVKFSQWCLRNQYIRTCIYAGGRIYLLTCIRLFYTCIYLHSCTLTYIKHQYPHFLQQTFPSTHENKWLMNNFPTSCFKQTPINV